jgi:hypothetical protein
MLSSLTDTSLHHKAFRYGMYLSYVLFAITLTGIMYIDPMYLSSLDSALKYYVAIVLLVRFNPLASVPRKKADIKFNRSIAFSAGVFLLLTTAALSATKASAQVADAFL